MCLHSFWCSYSYLRLHIIRAHLIQYFNTNKNILRDAMWSRICPVELSMMMSSNGNILHVTGHLSGEFTGHRWIPLKRAVTRSFDVFVDLRLNGWLSKQSWGWWFETPPSPSWRHCNAYNKCCLMCVRNFHLALCPAYGYIYYEASLLLILCNQPSKQQCCAIIPQIKSTH